MPAVKSGPLTRAELQQVWEGSVDEGYRDPLVAAGEGEGFEAWTQLFDQLARASKAVDVTTQAMFISPWSGQTNPPAAGEAKSEVTLTISRSGRIDRALLLGAGQVVAVEETTDSGATGSVTVLTGRRYVLAADLFFPPGVTGPKTVLARAEFAGYGFDNPLPGTIKAFDQVGENFENDLATVTQLNQPAALGGPSNTTKVTADKQPDMFVPEHVGQYVLFKAGANAGKIGRVVEFEPPIAGVAGSIARIEQLYSFQIGMISGTFQVGETVKISFGPTTFGYGRVVDSSLVAGFQILSFVLINGTLVAGSKAFTGLTSGASGFSAAMHEEGSFAAEAPVGGSGGATWRVMDWVVDWGLTVTNELSPAGGRAGFLDELGSERNIDRSPDEPDEIYRQRVREIADVVSPNAIRRALNRAIPGMPWCFREAGTTWPGFFYDGTNEAPSATPHGAENDFYDVYVIQITGALTGVFRDDESVVIENATTNVLHVSGFFGKIENLGFGDYKITIIHKSGTMVTALSNVRVRGLSSGATLTGLFDLATTSPEATKRRFRTYLDYEQFRGFFFVSLPRLAFGEFGFAYDASSELWGYDLLGSYAVFFDGFPAQADDVYGRVWAALENARAAGVGFDLNQDGGSCP